MAAAAKWLVERGLAESVDINMGCPVRKVVKTGGGSSMMCDTTGATIDLVRQVVEAVPVPVTVKMRLGWDDTNLSAPYFAREFEKVGVAAVTIHGRTREQGFGGGVNHDGIRRVVDAVERIPVFGNGDVLSIADAARMIEDTGCDGIAIGRGALANPWIFRQISEYLATGTYWQPAQSDRYEIMKRYFTMLEETDWPEAVGKMKQFTSYFTHGVRNGRAAIMIYFGPLAAGAVVR